MPLDPREALVLEEKVLSGKLGTIWGAEYSNTNYGMEDTGMPHVNGAHAIGRLNHGEQLQADIGAAPAYDRPVTFVVEIRCPQNLGSYDLRRKQATLEASFRSTPNLEVGTDEDSYLYLRGIEATELPAMGGFIAVALRMRYVARYHYNAL